MEAALICREMGWTLEEYEKQPSDFIDTIAGLIYAEAKEIKRREQAAR